MQIKGIWFNPLCLSFTFFLCVLLQDLHLALFSCLLLSLTFSSSPLSCDSVKIQLQFYTTSWFNFDGCNDFPLLSQWQFPILTLIQCKCGICIHHKRMSLKRLESYPSWLLCLCQHPLSPIIQCGDHLDPYPRVPLEGTRYNAADNWWIQYVFHLQRHWYMPPLVYS